MGSFVQRDRARADALELAAERDRARADVGYAAPRASAPSNSNSVMAAPDLAVFVSYATWPADAPRFISHAASDSNDSRRHSESGRTRPRMNAASAGREQALRQGGPQAASEAEGHTQRLAHDNALEVAVLQEQLERLAHDNALEVGALQEQLEILAHDKALEVAALQEQLEKLDKESRESGEQLQRLRERGAASVNAAKLWVDEAVALERARYESSQSRLLPLQMYALLVLGYFKGLACIQQQQVHRSA